MKSEKHMRRGVRGNTAPGVKPKVAFEAEDIAKGNIQQKIQLLLRALKDVDAGADVAQLGNYPLTLRQFNLWHSETSGGQAVTKNSRLTLLRYSDLKLSAEGAMARLRQLKVSIEKKRSSSDNLAAARRNSLLQKEMRLICERELVKARLQRQDALNKLTSSEERHKSLEKEFRRVVGEMRAEIDRLKSENNQLIKNSEKILSFRKI